MKYIFLLSICLTFASCENSKRSEEWIELCNPIIPGYFADPSIVEYDGKFYLYVTTDPWGAEFLSCWESEDFRNWTFNKLNWPTKEACTSYNSNHNNVWAPSVIKKGDKFYMYVSVGSEVWCGQANHPLGPWKNILSDKPMIPFDTTRYYHVIDAEAFIDDDGKSYLYWGSGWEWINGHCFAAELNDDMATFKSEPVEITPAHYFEGPFMTKHNSKYYLTYSEGKTIDQTYEVRYAMGDSPLGPFLEAQNSPILKTNDSLNVFGPGHHTIFSYQDRNYIMYHRHSLPFLTGTAMRQVCINEFEYGDTDFLIKNILPYSTQIFPKIIKEGIRYIQPESVTASSEESIHTSIQNISDNNFGTRWEAALVDTIPAVTIAFKEETYINNLKILFEYPWKNYRMKIETSENDTNWNLINDYTENGVTGSPVIVTINQSCKYLRLTFPKQESKPSVWELYFY